MQTYHTCVLLCKEGDACYLSSIIRTCDFPIHTLHLTLSLRHVISTWSKLAFTLLRKSVYRLLISRLVNMSSGNGKLILFLLQVFTLLNRNVHSPFTGIDKMAIGIETNQITPPVCHHILNPHRTANWCRMSVVRRNANDPALDVVGYFTTFTHKCIWRRFFFHFIWLILTPISSRPYTSCQRSASQI